MKYPRSERGNVTDANVQKKEVSPCGFLGSYGKLAVEFVGVSGRGSEMGHWQPGTGTIHMEFSGGPHG